MNKTFIELQAELNDMFISHLKENNVEPLFSKYNFAKAGTMLVGVFVISLVWHAGNFKSLQNNSDR